MHKDLTIITGPTAVGKTELALRWAEQHDAEILSCDSLLFYRHMNVGTAKPTVQELERVPHHGIDLVDPNTRYDVGTFVAYAQGVISDIHSRGKRVLIAGGSGFYLKAFFEAVTDNIQIPETIKAKVLELFETKGNAGIIDALKAFPGNDLERLDTQNPRRTVPALERCMASGMTLQEQRAQFAAVRSPFSDYPKHTYVLTRDRDALASRIELRVDQMLEQGLVDEVKHLRTLGFETNTSAARSIGYREVLAWLDGQIDSEDAMREQIIIDTRQLARKQRIWLRSQIPVDTHLDMDALSTEEALQIMGD